MRLDALSPAVPAVGQRWDLIVTMDDATSEVYSGFFVEQEGTLSSFRGVQETIAANGLFSSFYSDRGSHYWLTPKAGGPVDKTQLTQFGGMTLQIPAQQHRCHFVKAKVRVYAYPDGTYAIFHGPRRLANYDAAGACSSEKAAKKKAVA